MHDEVTHREQTNGLGLAGFIVSLIGLVSGGCLSPIGLVMSFIAVFKEPRGFAVAGLILGVIGTFGGLIALGVVLLFGVAALFVMIASLIAAPQVEGGMEMALLNEAVEKYQSANGALPTTLDDLELWNSMRTDPWDNPYIYEIDAEAGTFRIYSAGPDGVAGTEDDMTMDNIEEWSRQFQNSGRSGSDSDADSDSGSESEAGSDSEN